MSITRLDPIDTGVRNIKKVVFVGEQSNHKNVSSEIAFVGSRSFTRLVEWIGVIQPAYYVVVNALDRKGEYHLDNLTSVAALYSVDFKVVALGIKASRALAKLNIEHFYLPHPSGLNRALNDKGFVAENLAACKEWVHD